MTIASSATQNRRSIEGGGTTYAAIAFARPGDVLVGDQDGIVVVAREALEAVATALDEVKSKEAAMDELVRQGARVPPWLDAAFAEKGVRYLD